MAQDLAQLSEQPDGVVPLRFFLFPECALGCNEGTDARVPLVMLLLMMTVMPMTTVVVVVMMMNGDDGPQGSRACLLPVHHGLPAEAARSSPAVRMAVLG